MSVKKSGILFTILSITFVLQGCTQPAETNVAKNNNTNQSLQTSNSNAVVNTLSSSEANRTAVTINNSASTANTKTVTQTSEPAAKTTAGANDLAIFTSIRSKLNVDKELMNNVLIDIKQGNVVLTGNVSSEAQKKKAEDTAKSVEGIKSLKNNLKVGQ